MKHIVFKGTIKSVLAEIDEIAKEYDGWTVEQFMGLATFNKGAYNGHQQKKF